MPINLRPDEPLLFLHIPRTGGASILSLLSQRFVVSDAPAANPDDALRVVCAYDTPYGPYSDLYAQLRRYPPMLTVVRDPLERVYSLYQAARSTNRIPPTMPLLEFVRDPQNARAVNNGQTRLLAGTPRAAAPLPDATLLTLAKETLEQCVWVGVTDWLEVSMHILADNFNLDLPENLPRLNVSTVPFNDQTLTAAERDAIQSANTLDAALVQYAKDLVMTRLTALTKHYIAHNAEQQAQIERLSAYVAHLEQVMRAPLKLWSGRVIRSVQRRLGQQKNDKQPI